VTVKILVTGERGGQSWEYGIDRQTNAPVVRVVGGPWKMLHPPCASYREACATLGRMVPELTHAKFLVPRDDRNAAQLASEFRARQEMAAFDVEMAERTSEEREAAAQAMHAAYAPGRRSA